MDKIAKLFVLFLATAAWNVLLLSNREWNGKNIYWKVQFERTGSQQQDKAVNRTYVTIPLRHNKSKAIRSTLISLNRNR